jgi:hypothetical protein
MSRLSTLALYLTLCTKLVTSQTTAETCAADPTDYQACFDACQSNTANHQACCAAGDVEACCAKDPNDYEACGQACDADPENNHQACCAAGDIEACCDADEDKVGEYKKKAGCCYKALTDDDSATVCLVTPIDSAELKKQQNSAPC